MIIAVSCAVVAIVLHLTLPAQRLEESTEEAATEVTNLARVIELLAEARVYRETLSSSELSSFIGLTLAPAAFRMRTHDVLSVRRDFSERTVTTTFSLQDWILPAGEIGAKKADEEAAAKPRIVNGQVRASMLIPFLTAPKGKLYDKFELLTPSREESRILAYREQLLLVVCCANLLISLAFRLPQDPESWSEDQNVILLRAVELISLAPRRHQQIAQRLWSSTTVDELLTDMRELGASNENQLQQLGTFLRKYLNSYTLVLAHPVVGMASVKYSYTRRTRDLLRVVPNTETYGTTVLLRQIFRRMSGALFLPLIRAGDSSSYHLEIEVPAGSYAAGVDVIDKDGKRVAPRHTEVNQHSWYFRQPRAGSSRIHFYSRRFGSTQASWVLRARIYERPWGTIFLAAAAGVLVAPMPVLLSIGSHLGAKSTVDVVAAGVGIPAGIAGLVSTYIAVARRSLAPSFQAAVYSCVSVANLMAALAIYVAQLRASGTNVDTRYKLQWHVVEAAGVLTPTIAVCILFIRFVQFERVAAKRFALDQK